MEGERPQLRCPPDCTDKEVHQEFFRKYVAWQEKQLREGLPVPVERLDIHAPNIFPAIGPSHDEKCPLLYCCRSQIREVAHGMATVLQMAADSIPPRIEVTCVESSRLICQTKLRSGVSASNQIEFSHGFHFFCLNTSTLVAAFLLQEMTGKIPAVPLERARDLFEQQISFFWTQTPKEALLFPYWEFDQKSYSLACEITFLMITFLMAHEMAHLFVPVVEVEKTLFGGVEENARTYIESIPPPFLSQCPNPKWKDYWVEELLCDALATQSIFLCSQENAAALPQAPAICERAQEDRYMAIEALTMNIEALYWYNTVHGRNQALLSLYSPTHPLPNIRRVFLRGFAEQVNPDYLKMARVYDTALKKLTPMPS